MNTQPSDAQVAYDFDNRLKDVETRVWNSKRHLVATRWALVGAVACALGLAGLDAQTRIPQSVTAQSFDLRDSSGRIRGRLGMSGETPTLELFNAKEERVVELKGDGIPSLLLQDMLAPGNNFLMAFPRNLSLNSAVGKIS